MHHHPLSILLSRFFCFETLSLASNCDWSSTSRSWVHDINLDGKLTICTSTLFIIKSIKKHIVGPWWAWKKHKAMKYRALSSLRRLLLYDCKYHSLWWRPHAPRQANCVRSMPSNSMQWPIWALWGCQVDKDFKFSAGMQWFSPTHR